MPGAMNDSLYDMARFALAKQAGVTKRAFVPGADMSGGGAPPGDPAAQGMPPGGDPAAAGGGMAAGGQDPFAVIQQLQQQMMQMQQQMQQMGQGGGAAAGAGGAGGAGGAAGALKPKIDTNVVLLQILKTQARMCDHLGIPVPASEMVATQNDLMGLAQASQSGGAMPGMDPSAQVGGAGGQAAGAIGGMPAMQPAGTPGAAPEKAAAYRPNGSGVDPVSYAGTSVDRLAAVRHLFEARRNR